MIFILLPAYNEELSFIPLIEKLQSALAPLETEYKVLICNDGSTIRPKRF